MRSRPWIWTLLSLAVLGGAWVALTTDFGDGPAVQDLFLPGPAEVWEGFPRPRRQRLQPAHPYRRQPRAGADRLRQRRHRRHAARAGDGPGAAHQRRVRPADRVSAPAAATRLRRTADRLVRHRRDQPLRAAVPGGPAGRGGGGAGGGAQRVAAADPGGAHARRIRAADLLARRVPLGAGGDFHGRAAGGRHRLCHADRRRDHRRQHRGSAG